MAVQLSKCSFFKLLELSLAIACLVLHYKTMGENDLHTIMILNGTFVGFTIILTGLFFGFITGAPVTKRIDAFYCIAGCALFIISGVLVIQFWENSIFQTHTRKLALSKGSLAIINGVLFFFDLLFACRE